ncbi:MAG: hypothetical protein KGL39_08715 [Patescibacteria group bacterium]|nr:hypothetical protein [Patescibacteria group bacterium]
MHEVVLLSNGNASGTLKSWPGGMGVFTVAGTFGGATVKLQFQGPDGTTLIDAGTATTLTAVGAGVFYLPPGQIVATVVGGTPSGLYVTASRVPGNA